MALLILQEAIDSVWVDCQMYIEQMPVKEHDYTLVKESSWTANLAMCGFVACAIIQYLYKVTTSTIKPAELLVMPSIKYILKHT